MMRHPAQIYIFSAISLLAVQTAGAAKNQTSPYTGSLAVGFNQFDYSNKLDAPLTFDVATINVTAGWDNAYLAVEFTQDISTADISEQRETGRAGREEQEIILGYRLSKRLWVFVGDHNGETTMDFQSRQVDGERRSEVYKTEGLLYGLAYSYPLKRNGVLKFTATRAELDTLNRFGAPQNAVPLTEVEFNELSGDRNGTTEGWGYGITWLMPLSDTLYYQAQYEINDYEQSVIVSDLIEAGDEVNNTSDDSLRQLTMGFKLLF